MNSVSLIGRLTKKVEMKKSVTGKSYCSFIIAVNKNKEETNFIPCIAWEKTADLIVNYTDKGKMIGCVGMITQRLNKNNDNVIEVLVTNVTLM